MAFQKATVIELHQIRDANSVVIGIRLAVELRDDTTTEMESFVYIIKGTEFTSLPTGVAAKKAALVAILKREAHKAYDRWIAQIATRPKPVVVRDVLSDLGTNEITNFTGEAAPLVVT
jgi:hypothetical protein